MKFKIYPVLIIIFLIFCSVSSVAAVDINETNISQNFNVDNDMVSIEDNSNFEKVSLNSTNDLIDDNDILSIEDNYIDNCDVEIVSLNSTNDNYENSSVLSSTNIKDTENVYGIVDYGTNVISLNVYKEENGKIKAIFNENRDSVNIKYAENNELTQEGINQLLLILNDYDKIMNSKNVTVKYIFATASLRNINNGNEVIRTVKNQSGFDIHILSGEDEARMGFNAFKKVDLTKDEGILIDLGGGSCEVTIFANETPVFENSMPIGSSVCYKQYVSSIFPNESEIVNIQNRIKMELNNLNINNSLSIDDLYGTGGTIYTIKLLLIYLGEIDNNTYVIPTSVLDSTLNKLLGNTTEAYEIISNVDPKRINTLIPGMIITKEILNYFQVKNMHFCKSQIVDGIVYELIDNMSACSQSNTTSDPIKIA